MAENRRKIVDAIARLPFGARFLIEAARLKKEARVLLRSMTPWERLEQKWPNNLNIEVTNICNANCVFCAYQFQSQWRSDKGIIGRERFETVIEAHAKNGGTFVSLTPFLGDPLVDPDIVGKVRHITQRGLAVAFFTNGILLNRLDLADLLDSGLQFITISTGPLDRNLFERIYRSKQYDDLLHGLVRLLTLRNEMGVEFKVNLSFRSPLSFSATLGLPDFRKTVWPLLTAVERAEIMVMNSFDDWAGQITQGDLLPGMRLQAPSRLKHRPCRWTFIPYVTWDGLVRACACRFLPSPQGDDELVVGDLKQASLTEIWLGDRVKALRRRFPTGVLPLVCEKCPVYDPC
jgi:MoaA/NifB/PqqE/SkfB family radical SAM enzyme